MIKNGLLLIALCFLLLSMQCVAQQKNIDLLDSLAQQAVTKIVPGLQALRSDSLAIRIAGHEASYLISDKMVTALADTYILNDRALTVCSLSLIDFGVHYTQTSNADSLIREVCLKGSGTVRTKTSDIHALPALQMFVRDTIARSSIAGIENASLPYTQAPIPPMPSSFWQEIAEPIIFVSGAALTVFLLFSLRSN